MNDRPMVGTVDDLLAEAQRAAFRGRMQAMVAQQEVSRLLRKVRFLGRTDARDQMKTKVNIMVDIAQMPGFDPSVPNGSDSVSCGRVYFGLPASGGGIPTVCCVDHGAVLCVAKNDAGKIWRCPTCNEGAFEPVSDPDWSEDAEGYVVAPLDWRGAK